MEVTFSAKKTMLNNVTIIAVVMGVVAMSAVSVKLPGRPGIVLCMLGGHLLGTAIVIAIYRRLPLMRRHDIVIDDTSVHGPSVAGMTIGPRRRVPVSSIDLDNSQRSFWRGSFLRTHSGERIVVAHFCFDADQMAEIKETIRERQGQQPPPAYPEGCADAPSASAEA